MKKKEIIQEYIDTLGDTKEAREIALGDLRLSSGLDDEGDAKCEEEQGFYERGVQEEYDFYDSFSEDSYDE